MSGRTDPKRDQLRRSLAARLEAFAAFRLSRVRGARSGDAESLEIAYDGLATVRARETLCELRESGSELDLACDTALGHHLVRLAGEHASSEEIDAFDAKWTLATVSAGARSMVAPSAMIAAIDEPERTLRDRWATAVLPTARPSVRPWLDLRAAESGGRSAAAYELAMKRDTERAALPERAKTLLAETDDLAREALDFLGAARIAADAWHQVAAAIELPARSGTAEAPDRRVRRTTAWLTDLGLAERVARGVRVCPVTVPIVRALPLGAAKVGLVIGPGAGERLERETFGAIGQAIARTLVDPTLPIEVRWPAWPWLPHMVGAVCERLLTHPRFLLRLLDGAAAPEELARRFALAGVLRLRLVAAGVVAAAEGAAIGGAAGSHGVEAVGELARSAIERAIRVSVPLELAALWMPRRWRAEVELSGRLAALDVERALVERHDEDFFRNPRCGRTLSMLCAAGAIASPDTVRDATGASAASSPAASLVSLLEQTGAV